MPRLSLGLGVQTIRKFGGGGAAPITTSRAFNSSGVQVGSTITGNIPDNWLDGEVTVTSVIFANDNSVTSIGGYAFVGIAVTSITIPSGVTSIGYYAFKQCGSLTSITIPNSVTSIAGYAFAGSGGLSTVLCYAAQSAFNASSGAFYNTASPLTIRARSTDASWTAGTGLDFQGNANVTVIKDL